VSSLVLAHFFKVRENLAQSRKRSNDPPIPDIENYVPVRC